MDFNKTFFGGRLTRDPEVRTIPNSNTTVVNLSIASNRVWKDGNGEKREEATFIEAEAFGKQADLIAQYFIKGKKIFIEGRLRLDQWENKDGDKRSKLKVVVEVFKFVDSNDQASDSPAPSARSAPASQENIPVEAGDIPF